MAEEAWRQGAVAGSRETAPQTSDRKLEMKWVHELSKPMPRDAFLKDSVS